MTTTKNRVLLPSLALVLVLAGCSGEPQPVPSTSAVTSPAPSAPTPDVEASGVPLGEQGEPRGGLVDVAAVDPANADQVADAVAKTMETVDTRLDLSPTDASRRAAAWLTPQYLDLVSTPLPGGGGAEWLELEEADGYTVVTVTDATEMGQPEDTDTQAFRARATSADRLGESWKGETIELVYFITLTRTDAQSPWLVDAIEVG